MKHVKVYVIALALCALLRGTTAIAAQPGQFVAKMYTEALGRIPDQGGWQFWTNWLSSNGCLATSLASVGQSFYTSSEFYALNLDNAGKLEALYRGSLNNDPDPDGFNYWYGLLNTGTPWSSVVSSFFASTPFQGLVSAICTESYGWGSGAPVVLPTTNTGHFAGGTGSQLQALLNATAPGGTVYLEQKAQVALSATLTIPSGVTLTTWGSVSRNAYSMMGRLLRVARFSPAGPMVVINPGARLDSVWVDGHRGSLGQTTSTNSGDISIQTAGGIGATVNACRLSDTSGWTNLQALGANQSHPCAGTTLSGNLVTGYANDHWTSGQWADGLSIGCEHTAATNNEIVDATDVGIVVFNAGTIAQESQVTSNLILNAGNSVYASIGIENGYLPDDPTHPSHSFQGTAFDSNVFWTSTTAHTDIGITVGSRAWWGANTSGGTGASFTNNSTGTLTARANDGIAIANMLNATVTGNTVSRIQVNSIQCPLADTAASVSAGWASGTIQSPYQDVAVSGCLTHTGVH